VLPELELEEDSANSIEYIRIGRQKLTEVSNLSLIRAFSSGHGRWLVMIIMRVCIAPTFLAWSYGRIATNYANLAVKCSKSYTLASFL